MGEPGAVLHRAAGAFGELVLRVAADGHHEVISNGTFLMDTRDGRSERGLVAEALAAAERAPAGRASPGVGAGEQRPAPAPTTAGGRGLDVLVAGLGVGFSLAQALTSRRVASVMVVEVEPAVVALVRGGLGAVTGADLDDPRVEVLVADLVELLEAGWRPAVDVVCLDVDNGPGWTLSPANARLYDDEGLVALRRLLRPGGVLAVWSAHDDESFSARLASVVGSVETHRYQRARGEPDVVWVARSRS